METLSNGWTISQRQFMVWLATPVELRDCRTEREYRAKYHIGPNTLIKWRRTPGFWTEVKALTDQYMADAVPEVLATMKNQARLGSFPHQKLYLEMVGLYTPRSEQTLTVKRPYADTTDDELQAAIDAEIAAIIPPARSGS
jgi:hypothetical protein